jgi:hypothetical protein
LACLTFKSDVKLAVGSAERNDPDASEDKILKSDVVCITKENRENICGVSPFSSQY